MLLRILAVVCFCAFTADALAARPETPAAVLELPEIARIDDIGPTVVIVRGKLSKRRQRQLTRLARAVYGDVKRRFMVPGQSPAPVHLCLFESSRGYQAFVREVFGPGDHSPLGFYRGDARVVVANLARSVGNLRHELVHPLLGDNFPDMPGWFNEGMGSLYGSADRRRLGFRFRVNYRLRAVKAALRRKSLPSLRELAYSTRGELYGPRSATYYGLARYVLLYLERRGTLDAFVRDLRAAKGKSRAEHAVLSRYIDYGAFKAWASKLRYRRPSR